MVTGHELRLLRHLHEIKQETLAKKLNITQQAYSKLEKNQCINGKRLHQIITALGYTKKEFEKAIKKLPPPPEKISNWQLAIGHLSGRFHAEKENTKMFAHTHNSA